MRRATHVVVDTKDGYTFWAGSDGELFDCTSAAAFAANRNAAMKPEHRSYMVFRLEATTATRQAMQALELARNP